MFGDNFGVDLKITEDNSYNLKLEVNIFRDGYIFVTLGFILIVTTYFFDPVKELTMYEILFKGAIFKASGILLIVYAFFNNFKKYSFAFAVTEKICEIKERHLFFYRRQRKVKFEEINFSLEIINGEGPTRYQASLFVNDERFLLGDAADSENFESYMLRLQDIGIECFGV